jgi:hypothetical protein
MDLRSIGQGALTIHCKENPLNSAEMTSAKEEAWELLSGNPWLQKKTGRGRRLKELREYVDTYLPEMKERPLQGFLDIGPGPGELIELAMAESMDGYGWDAESPEGGMGNDYLRYSRLMHTTRGLDVTYCNDFRPISTRFRNALSIINLRGSIEQVMSPYMVGEPHHVHQDCRKLAWDETLGEGALISFFRVMRESLTDNGILMIAANGAMNVDWYDDAVRRLSGECFSSMETFNARTHKFYV